MSRQAHPILQVIHDRGMSVRQFNKLLPYTYVHTREAIMGYRPAARRFRMVCSLVLGVPESDLFSTNGKETAERC